MRLGFGLILAAWLGPKNYGIVAQATVYIVLVGVFLDQGLAATLIQRPRVRSEDQGTVFVVTALAGLVFAGLTVAVADPLAAFFRTAELEAVLRVLALSVLLKALTVVPQALIVRRLRFRRLAVAETASVLIGGIAALTAAALGLEYWSLVVMVLTTDVVMFAVLASAAGRPHMRYSREAWREMRSFSLSVFGYQILNYLTRNADNIIVARVLGPSALGLYALSYRVMMLPVLNLGMVVNRVALPTYSRVQADRVRLRRQFLIGTRMLALVSFPVMTVVIVESPRLVPAALGEDWADAVLPMQILAITGMRQAVTTLAGPLMLACGRADLQFRIGLAQSLVLTVGFLIGVNAGIVGVAWAVTIGNLLLAPFLIFYFGRLVQLSVLQYVAALVPAAVAAGSGAAVGLALTPALEGMGASALAAGLGGSAGILLGALVVYRALWRAELAEARSLLRLMAGAVSAPRSVTA